jgi:hypothetical protein
MRELCDKHIKSLREYSRGLQENNSSRRISFFNKDIPENSFSLGKKPIFLQI